MVAERVPATVSQPIPFFSNEIREVGGRFYVASMPRQVTATAYDACVLCTGKTDGITRTGTEARPFYTLAVDPDIVPLGSLVVIDEFPGIYRAEDTGGAIQGNRIDVFLPSHSEAVLFGQQPCTIRILTPIS